MPTNVEETIEVLNFPKGKVLFKQGDKSDAAYIVNSGAVGMYREAQGRKVPLTTVRRGELFGEMAVIDDSPRMATAFALEDCAIMVVPYRIMLDKLRKADPFMRAIINMLMNNLRGAHENYMPKSRSLADASNMLSRQSDVIAKFLQPDLPPAFTADMTGKLKNLEVVIKDLRRVAALHKEEDKRDDANPSEADLPQ